MVTRVLDWRVSSIVALLASDFLLLLLIPAVFFVLDLELCFLVILHIGVIIWIESLAFKTIHNLLASVGEPVVILRADNFSLDTILIVIFLLATHNNVLNDNSIFFQDFDLPFGFEGFSLIFGQTSLFGFSGFFLESLVSFVPQNLIAFDLCIVANSEFDFLLLVDDIPSPCSDYNTSVVLLNCQVTSLILLAVFELGIPVVLELHIQGLS